MRAIYLAQKDLLQILRDWKAAFFLLIMPIAFTLLFGFAFGGFGGDEEVDPRLPVGLLDSDGGELTSHLVTLLEDSDVIRLVLAEGDAAELERLVSDEELAAAIIVPKGYSEKILAGQTIPLTLIAAGGSPDFTVQGEIQAAAMRLNTALQAAELSTAAYSGRVGFNDQLAEDTFFNDALGRAVSAWRQPPIALQALGTGASRQTETVNDENAFSQTSPGMMAQFAIAGLMGASAVLVMERKNRALQRLLTTPISKAEILLGHYLAMFVMIFVQLVLLIVFGQLLLRLDYFGRPLATLLMVTVTAMFVASLGLLIGALAKNEEQVIIFALIPMFLLAGLGGAWAPLEITPEGFQRVARLTPVAWIMDGFQDIIIRGQGLEAVWLAALVLTGFTLLLIILAVWQFRYE